MGIEAYLVLAAPLFAVDVLGFLLRRSTIIAFMSVELMLNTANLVLVTFARQHSKPDGQVVSLFVMVAVVAEAVVGLAIVVAIYRAHRSASVDGANLLKL